MLYERQEPQLPKHPLTERMHSAECAAYYDATAQLRIIALACKIEIGLRDIDEMTDYEKGRAQ